MNAEADQRRANNVDIKRLLDLLSAQVAAALLDIESPQHAITAFFTTVVSHIEKLQELLADSDTKHSEAIDVLLATIPASAKQSIIELQAFDRVEQRLRHVEHNLHLIADSSRHRNGEVYFTSQSSLPDKLRSTYSLSHEHTLHRMMEDGANRSQLLEFSAHKHQPDETENIELF